MTRAEHLGQAERVELASISQHPENPNNGDIDAIAESLRVTGQFRPIVVQKSTRHILAGNHTFAAALSLGWTHLDAWVVDVDNDTARRILLADNRYAQLARMDNALLVEILKDMPDLAGTGYTDDDVNRILAEIAERPEPDAPDEFPSYDDETIPTNLECPRCSYTWSQ